MSPPRLQGFEAQLSPAGGGGGAAALNASALGLLLNVPCHDTMPQPAHAGQHEMKQSCRELYSLLYLAGARGECNDR